VAIFDKKLQKNLVMSKICCNFAAAFDEKVIAMAG